MKSFLSFHIQNTHIQSNIFISKLTKILWKKEQVSAYKINKHEIKYDVYDKIKRLLQNKCYTQPLKHNLLHIECDSDLI